MAAVTKKFRWTNADGETMEVEFGADGGNVSVNGTPLTDILSTLQGSSHAHGNKTILDELTSEKVAAWDAKLSDTYVKSAGYGDYTYHNCDLNNIRENGIYSVYSLTPAQHHYPILNCGNGVKKSLNVGALIVCGNLDGVSQIYVNYGIDWGDETYWEQTPLIAYRTLTGNSGGSNPVDSDWKFIGPDVYSTTPQLIGYWIDGTPIWRVAFNEDIASGDLTWTDKSWTPFGNVVSFKNYNNVFVLSGQAFLRSSSAPCQVDDPIVSITSVSACFEWSHGGTYEGIYGYVDFVTAESNIKTT